MSAACWFKEAERDNFAPPPAVLGLGYRSENPSIFSLSPGQPKSEKTVPKSSEGHPRNDPKNHERSDFCRRWLFIYILYENLEGPQMSWFWLKDQYRKRPPKKGLFAFAAQKTLKKHSQNRSETFKIGFRLPRYPFCYSHVPQAVKMSPHGTKNRRSKPAKLHFLVPKSTATISEIRRFEKTSSNEHPETGITTHA